MKIDVFDEICAIVKISEYYKKYDVFDSEEEYAMFAIKAADILIDLFKGAEE